MDIPSTPTTSPIGQAPHTRQPWSRSDLLFFIGTSLFLAFLLAGSGIYSDDFCEVGLHPSATWDTIALPSGNAITVPLTHYFFRIFYRLASFESLHWVCGAKIVWSILSLYLISSFISLWHSRTFAIYLSALWIALPIHDATFYWLIGHYLTLSAAFLMYSAYSLCRNRRATALICAIIGSWLSYGSPAVVGALCIMMWSRREWKKSLWLLIPNLLYILYYIICTSYFQVYLSRIQVNPSATSLVKNGIKQLASFIDAVCGPSMGVKLFLTIGEIGVLSTVVALATTAILFFVYKKMSTAEHLARPLLLFSIALLLLNALMFATTAAYPQISFNLGNRVTLFSSFAVLYLLTTALFKRPYLMALLNLTLLLAICGNRDKFIAIDSAQSQVVTRILESPALHSRQSTAPLFVIGNQYHRLGPISDIEFLSEHWVISGILRNTHKNIDTSYALNRRWTVTNKLLIDRKYGTEVPIPIDGIEVYDSDMDQLYRIAPQEIASFLQNLPTHKRHWAQFITNPTWRKKIAQNIKALSYDL